ncbi:MAG: leucine-rich repeat protein, partial [Clostridia bacterium]|nr:leucine-rich repeat protein [Clostridia bacterium]
MKNKKVLLSLLFCLGISCLAVAFGGCGGDNSSSSSASSSSTSSSESASESDTASDTTSDTNSSTVEDTSSDDSTAPGDLTEDEAGTEGVIYDRAYRENYAVVIGYTGVESEIKIASTYQGMPVKRIYDSAFRDVTILESVKIPEGITHIGNRAFERCGNLSSIEIPRTL